MGHFQSLKAKSLITICAHSHTLLLRPPKEGAREAVCKVGCGLPHYQLGDDRILLSLPREKEMALGHPRKEVGTSDANSTPLSL